MHKAIKVLYAFNGLYMLAAAMLGPLYAIFVSKIDSDILTVSISWSVFLVSTTLFSLFFSRMKDNFIAKEKLLMVGYLVRGVCWFSYIFVSDIYMLIFVQFVLGLGEALGSPGFNTLFAEHLDKAKHIREYEDLNIIHNLCNAIGAAMGGLIVSKFGFIPMFSIMSFLAFISFIGIYLNRKSFRLSQA